jgi:hypothetical protein
MEVYIGSPFNERIFVGEMLCLSNRNTTVAVKQSNIYQRRYIIQSVRQEHRIQSDAIPFFCHERIDTVLVLTRYILVIVTQG